MFSIIKISSILDNASKLVEAVSTKDELDKVYLTCINETGLSELVDVNTPKEDVIKQLEGYHCALTELTVEFLERVIDKEGEL